MTWREQWEELRNDPEHRAYILGEEAKHTIASKVYSLRKERGFSQTELARLVGTRQPNISDIETADANVTIETLGKLAAALGVSVADLLVEPGSRGRDHDAIEQSRITSASMSPIHAVYLASGFTGFGRTQGLKMVVEDSRDKSEEHPIGFAGSTW